MNWRDAGSDGRSTGEPGRPVLLFQQLREGRRVPPDFLSSGPLAYAAGSCSGDFQTSIPPDHPAVSAVPRANALEKGARTPRGTRQAEEALEGAACSSFCQEKPRAETFICAGCLPVPSPRNNGGLSRAGLGAQLSSKGLEQAKRYSSSIKASADGSRVPEVPCRGLCHKKYYRKVSQMFFWVGFFFSLSQVFKALWTFPCPSTYLGKWEGRK